MIRRTFLFLDRISHKTEQNIWDQGIEDWHDFLESNNVKGIGSRAKAYHNRKVLEARQNLYKFNSSYFTNILPQSEHWRLYDFFKEDCCYIDIETSTVKDAGYVTVIGLYDRLDTKTMVHGINLDYTKLKNHLRRYKMLVSFNGSVFDAPFLKKQMPDLLPDIPHFDLRHACQRLGIKGGLKQVERTLGLKRENEIVDKMYGGDQMRLWRRYLATGDRYFLALLIDYNEEDVVNLKPIADFVYHNLKNKTLMQALN